MVASTSTGNFGVGLCGWPDKCRRNHSTFLLPDGRHVVDEGRRQLANVGTSADARGCHVGVGELAGPQANLLTGFFSALGPDEEVL